MVPNIRNMFGEKDYVIKPTKIVFDLGVHTGEDADFYLNKGFKVIGVEANPSLCESLRSRFSSFINSNGFVLYDAAIVEDSSEKVKIYLNEEKSDWSSLIETVASKGSYSVNEQEVDTITLEELFKVHGTPYYLKVDLELYDVNIARALLKLEQRPQYVSFEIHDQEVLDILSECGYNKFQIRNQLFNGFITKPEPTYEGSDYWPGPMGGYHSGLFGMDLPKSDWRTFDETKALLEAYELLRPLDFLHYSWLDVHATFA
jgi:FkbM family methyltransferase